MACKSRGMDEKQFKKHLQDLVHGHHRPEEHDWEQPSPKRRKPAPKKKAKKRTK